MPNNSSQYLLILLNKRMSSIPTQIWTCWCLIWSWFLSLFQLHKLSVCIVACIIHDARPCLLLTEGPSGWMDTGIWCRRSPVSSHVLWFNCFKLLETHELLRHAYILIWDYCFLHFIEQQNEPPNAAKRLSDIWFTVVAAAISCTCWPAY